MIAWFRRTLAELGFEARPERPVPPILVRLVGARAERATEVEVEARWSPSGRVESRAMRPEQGLCLVPWRGGEVRVEVTIRHGDAAASVTVDEARCREGRVHELSFDPPAPTDAR